MSKGISYLVKNLGGAFSKNSSTILTAVSVAGLFTTAILAVKATPKAIRLLEEELEDRESELDDAWADVEPLTKLEVIKIAWRPYVPAAAICLATIGCIIGANHISLRRNAALASLYGITEAAFKEYRTKVVETIGQNKELKVRDEISADRVKKNPVGTNEIIFTGKGEVLCYDSLSGRYFKSDIEQIRRTVNELNKNLLNDMFLTLNELYYALGLAGTKLGDEMGWDLDKGLLDISFSFSGSEEGEPCLVLNYTVSPRFMK